MQVVLNLEIDFFIPFLCIPCRGDVPAIEIIRRY